MSVCLSLAPRETHLRLLSYSAEVRGNKQKGQKEARLLQAGWCNLIGGHSCINMGIEEFLSP